MKRIARVPGREKRNPGNDCGPGRVLRGAAPHRLLFNLGNQRPTRDDRRGACAAIRHVIILHRNREGRGGWQAGKEEGGSLTPACE